MAGFAWRLAYLRRHVEGSILVFGITSMAWHDRYNDTTRFDEDANASDTLLPGRLRRGRYIDFAGMVSIIETQLSLLLIWEGAALVRVAASAVSRASVSRRVSIQ